MNDDLHGRATEDRGGDLREAAAVVGEAEHSPWTALLHQLAAGDGHALARLYDAAAPSLYGLALWRTGSTDDAADVVQEVFIRAAEQGPRLASVENGKAWLMTVAHRAAVDVVRKRSRRSETPVDACDFLAAPSAEVDRGVDAQRVSSRLAQLPAKQRDVIYLHHFAGCTFAEIGRIVGVPMFTAASRYRLGVAKLRRLLEVQS